VTPRRRRVADGGQAQGAPEGIRRARAILAATQAGLDRSENLLQRSAVQVAREQADVDRSVARSERDLQRQPPDPGMLMKRATMLRNQTVAAIAGPGKPGTGSTRNSDGTMTTGQGGTVTDARPAMSRNMHGMTVACDTDGNPVHPGNGQSSHTCKHRLRSRERRFESCWGRFVLTSEFVG
jgi:hypothetical protein